MGWHAGMLVARCRWDAFAAALHDATGVEIGEVTGRELPRDDAFGGEHAGQAYVCDPTLLLSVNGDRVVELSRTLDTLVIDAGAETVSGTYWLFAAERGELLRAYFACVSNLDAAFDRGAWPDASDLQDIDAARIHAAIAHGGFEFDAFIRHGVKWRLTPPVGHDRHTPGPIQAELDAFHAAHELPQHQRPQPRIVVRSAPAATKKPPPPPTPFDQLGGADRVRALVGRFYDHMHEHEPALARLHPCEPDGTVLRANRDRFALFLIGWLGGPNDYLRAHGHPRLRMRHARVAVDVAMRDAWLRCMTAAMVAEGITGEVRSFLDARFADVADLLRNTE